MLILKLVAFGFFIKFITGLDDTITRVPVIASITKTRAGKIAFSIGNLAAVSVAIVIAIFFSSLIIEIPYYKYITAGLLILLAAGIYFDFFVHKPREKAEANLLKMQKISIERFTKLMTIGFVASFATLLDDIIAYLPLYTTDNPWEMVWSSIGIISATIFQIILIIFFAEKITKIKYKEEIASAGLVILAVLLVLNIL